MKGRWCLCPCPPTAAAEVPDSPATPERPLSRQLRLVGPVVLVSFAAVGAVYLLAYGLAKAFDRPPIVLTEDPANLFPTPPYTAAFQYLGFLGWWAAAVLSGLAAWLLRTGGRRDDAFPLAGLCVISTWLLADDMFLAHESVLDEHLGIPQWVTFIVYALVTSWFFWRVREFVRGSDWLLLALCVALLTAGAIIDQAGDEFGYHYATPEKGLELLGITAWTLYVARCSLRHLTVADGVATPRG
jgi:uncharacterized membrane protein